MERRIRAQFRRLGPLLRLTGLHPRMTVAEQASGSCELGRLSHESELGPVLDGIAVPVRYVVAAGTSFGSRDEQERIRAGLEAVTARNANIQTMKVESDRGAILGGGAH